MLASEAAAQPAHPIWSAPATIEVIGEDIDFESGGIKLNGTFLFPISSGQVPVVIALHAASLTFA